MPLAAVEVRILPSLRGQETETLSFLMTVFQRNGSQVLERERKREMLVSCESCTFTDVNTVRAHHRVWLERPVNSPGTHKVRQGFWLGVGGVLGSS